jgi:hypothetical protein
MAERIVLSKGFEPDGGPAEDWWFLVIEDCGDMHVDHKWIRRNPFRRSGRQLRMRTYSINEILATSRHEPRGSLRLVLKQRGLR